MAGTPIIRSAGKQRRQVRIEYVNRRGRLIVRTVRPYEIKGGYLWATDTKHGAGKIHSFKITRIKGAEQIDRGYRPQWDVKF